MNEKVTFTKSVTCPECGGSGVWTRDGYKQDGFACEKCHGEGTIQKKVKFKLFKKCSICKGTGSYIAGGSFQKMKCPCCDGNKKLIHYITPAEWEKKMGEELREDSPVWGYDESDTYLKDWDLMTYGTAGVNHIMIIVLAITGQPAPPNDWRSEC